MRYVLAKSQYSVGVGCSTVEQMVEEAAQQGAEAFCLADINAVAGHTKLTKLCEKHGMTPIYGLAYDGSDSRSSEVTGLSQEYPSEDSCTLMAWGREGWHELCDVISGRLRPQAAIKTTRLIGGYGTRIYEAVANGDMRWAASMAREFVRSHDCSVGVLIPTDDLKWLPDVATSLHRLAEIVGIPTMRHAEARFDKRERARAARVFSAIGMGRMMNLGFVDSPTLNFGHLQVQDHPEAARLLHKVLDPEVMPWQEHIMHLPKLELDRPPELKLAQLAMDGLNRRLERIPESQHPQYRSRLTYELGVIEKMGYSSYFIIVADYVHWAIDQGIDVGIGRGSAVGSVVSWALEITGVDPIKYDLIFERFLNPLRSSMPDIDTDFSPDGREEVIGYLRGMYGADHVAQIMTWSGLAPQKAWRATCRATDMRHSEISSFNRTDWPHPDGTLAEGIAAGIFSHFDEDMTRRVEIAAQLEGLIVAKGTHPGGTILSPRPAHELAPVVDGCVQLDMEQVTELGMVKFDLLGLKELKVLRLAQDHSGVQVPDEDYGDKLAALAWDEICKGNTLGIFQLASPGMTRVIKRIAPRCIEDCTAAVALYRPGPLSSGMVDEYIDRKHGRKPVEVIHEVMSEPLKHTYGVIVYQEQVMDVSRAVGKMTPAEADMLRRAISKKKDMQRYLQLFIDGALEQGIDRDTAISIWSQMEGFASYGFNKSHACAYAILCFKTAWAKANIRGDYMAACIDVRESDRHLFIDECVRFGIRVVAPDLRRPTIYSRFDKRRNVITLGLGVLKGASSDLLALICREHARSPFRDAMDVFERIIPDKTTWSRLAASGALDCFAPHGIGGKALFVWRWQLVAEFSKHAKRVKKDRHGERGEAPQLGLFSREEVKRVFAEVEPFPEDLDKFAGEHVAALGMPLDSLYRQGKARRLSHTIAARNGEYRFIGALISAEPSYTAKGAAMMRAVIADESCCMEVVAFGEARHELQALTPGRLIDVKIHKELYKGAPSLRFKERT